MNKEELLQEIGAMLKTGELQKEEVLRQLEIAPAHDQRFSVPKMLYLVGGCIVVIGVFILVSQIWGDLGSLGRIAVTLILGVILAGNGSVLFQQNPDGKLGPVFHFMGGLLIPGGALITLNELVGEPSAWTLAITFAVIFVFYLLLNSIHKHPILTFFSIANGTAFVYLLIHALVPYVKDDFYTYLTMTIGLSYILFGQAFRVGWNRPLAGALHFFGITAFLGSAFSQVHDSLNWQISYLVILFVCLYASTYIKNRIILIMSTLFLLAHISFLTSKYFADSLGWPISLVLLGFIFIGIGYASLTINRKYINSDKMKKNLT